MATRGATSEVQPSSPHLLDVRVTPWRYQGEETVLSVSTKGPICPAYEVSLGLFGDPFDPDPTVRAEVWYEDTAPLAFDDPPTCDLGPPLTRGDLR